MRTSALRVVVFSSLLLLVLTLLAGCGGGGEAVGIAPQDEAITTAAASVAPDGQSRVLIRFKSRPGAADEELVRGVGGRLKHRYSLVPAIAASVPAEALDKLRRDPRVAVVEPDAVVTALGDTVPWGVDRVDAEVVQGGGNMGAGVKVAVIDTGVDYTHPDLNDNYKGGIDIINGDSDPMDDHGHGTHVAGTIAAEPDGAGVVGVAPRASLYAVKVLDATGNGTYSNIIAALQWCVDNGIQVASMSLGGSLGSSVLETACNNAAAAGVLLVAAAGNNGTSAGTGDTVTYPAKYASVIAVGATDQNNARPSWSSTGPAVELVAPGTNIYSTARGGGYTTMAGTSMACPHVSGVAALVIASGQASGPQGVRERLAATADDLGTAGRDTWYGYGLVDADEAAGAAAPTPAPAPAPTPEMHVASIVITKQTNASGTTAKATVTIVDAAGGPVSGATVSGHWSGLATDRDTGTTGTSGAVTLLSNKTKATSGTFMFTVDSVTKSGWIYVSSANSQTSGALALSAVSKKG